MSEPDSVRRCRWFAAAARCEGRTAPTMQKGDSVSNGRPATTDAELKRWEGVRRGFLAVVAQLQAADPTARYTLTIRIVQKDATDKVA